MNVMRFNCLVGLAAAAAIGLASPALAASTAKTTTKPAARAAAKPATPARPASAHMAARPASPAGQMVRVRLSNGRTVTYNCSLAGNRNKQACKR